MGTSFGHGTLLPTIRHGSYGTDDLREERSRKAQRSVWAAFTSKVLNKKRIAMKYNALVVLFII
jgi:hypothetical protein